MNYTELACLNVLICTRDKTDQFSNYFLLAEIATGSLLSNFCVEKVDHLTQLSTLLAVT